MGASATAHPGTELVRLFARDPGLLGNVDAATAGRLTPRVAVVGVRLPRGPVPSPLPGARPDDVAYVVLEGLLVQRVEVAGRRSAEVVGPGDVIRPAMPRRAVSPAWEVRAEALLAVLDRRFASSGALPIVMVELLDRLAARADRFAVQLALARLPRMDDRLHLLFWQLAARFGETTADGVRVRLPLSQEILAELTAARRQAVNVALQRLEGRGLLVAQSRDVWLLRDARSRAA